MVRPAQLARDYRPKTCTNGHEKYVNRETFYTTIGRHSKVNRIRSVPPIAAGDAGRNWVEIGNGVDSTRCASIKRVLYVIGTSCRAGVGLFDNRLFSAFDDPFTQSSNGRLCGFIFSFLIFLALGRRRFFFFSFSLFIALLFGRPGLAVVFAGRRFYHYADVDLRSQNWLHFNFGRLFIRLQT